MKARGQWMWLQREDPETTSKQQLSQSKLQIGSSD